MLKKIVFIILMICIISILPLSKSKAVETNNSEYLIVIEDDANLLTEEEEQNLKIKMEELKEFGNVMFKTTNTYNSSSSLRYIQNYYYSRFENRSGLAFYIDMNNRQLCLCATGGLDELITSSKCDTIMDNVYRYARKGNYYSCAIETFAQSNQLLNRQKIAESMKHICNAFLSVMISLFIGYGFVRVISHAKKATNYEIISESEMSLEHSQVEVQKTGSHKVYSPVSSSSSSGRSSSGGSSSSSGGGGGGGFSGSGGSHGF